MKHNILAVVVTYNRLELLKENIEMLLKQSNKNFDILIINNNCTDGTKEYLEQNYISNDRFTVITLGENLGGAGGFNLGMKYAFENNYQYAWLMDDDTIAEEHAIESLIESSKILDNKFSFLCSYVKWTDDSACKMNVPVLKNSFLEKQKYELLKRGLIEIERCSFVSCFINLNKVKDCGLPIKEFFIYYDDAEYTQRISKILPAYISINSVVLHKMKNNLSVTVEKLEDTSKINRLRFDFRNGYRYSKAQGIKTVIRYNIRYFYHLFKIIFSKSKFKIKKIKEITIGMWLGIWFNPKIEYLKDS